MDGNVTTEERPGEWSGEAPSLESLREMRLTALLVDVMDELGQVKAAEQLGIDRKTLWRCRNTGRLTPRLSVALERLLLTSDLSAAMRQGQRIEALAGRVAGLEEELRGLRQAVEGGIDAVREEQVKAMRQVERRLARLEAVKGADGALGTVPGSAETLSADPRWRQYRELVTLEAEPGEEQVYGGATPVIVEWRNARTEHSEAFTTGTALDRADAKIRLLELELALVEEHELTLPPASYPWDRSGRRDQAWRRGQSLDGARADRNRALGRRGLRRVLTLGLWRN